MKLLNNMKKIIQLTLIRCINWIYSFNLELEDLGAIKIMLREKLQLTEKNIEIVKLVLHEELSKVLNNAMLVQLQELAVLRRLDEIGDMTEGVQLCYSQEGESLILERFFNFKNNGFFVDVGAHDPKRFSNTYTFYKKGWRGINIEPTPGVMERFKLVRPEDITLPVAISDNEGYQDFYMFSEPALNPFSDQLSKEYQKLGCKLIETRKIKTRRLDAILEQYHIDQPIDFISIDVEGHELFVLQSNNWTRFRPKLLLLEILNSDIGKLESYAEHNVLINEGYFLYAKTFNTLIYKDNR